MPLGPWDLKVIPELVQLNFATLYYSTYNRKVLSESKFWTRVFDFQPLVLVASLAGVAACMLSNGKHVRIYTCVSSDNKF